MLDWHAQSPGFVLQLCINWEWFYHQNTCGWGMEAGGHLQLHREFKVSTWTKWDYLKKQNTESSAPSHARPMLWCCRLVSISLGSQDERTRFHGVEIWQSAWPSSGLGGCSPELSLSALAALTTWDVDLNPWRLRYSLMGSGECRPCLQSNLDSRILTAYLFFSWNKFFSLPVSGHIWDLSQW